jgi:hypothetical protein
MLKKLSFTTISFLIICTLLVLTACSSSGGSLDDIAEPDKFSATVDEVHPSQSPTAVEESDNVNGMHFTSTLKEFTSRYNNIMMESGGTNYLYHDNWKAQGDKQVDTNGVEYQLYYYDEDIFTMTAAVETSSNKLMNVGCGTTMNTFVEQNDDTNNSDIILHSCAIMAAAACGFNYTSLDVLQDIFYKTTFEGNNSLWYEGNMFVLTTKVDKSNSENSTMLFRLFPITNALKTEWNVQEYEKIDN